MISLSHKSHRMDLLIAGRTYVRLSLVLMALFALSRSVGAQQAITSHTSVVVALVTKLSGASEGDVGIIRRSPAGPDTIFLRNDRSDGESLIAAVFKLLAARQLMGTVVAMPMSVRVPFRGVPAAWSHGEVVRAGNVIRRLRRSRVLLLPDMGIAYVTTIRIANRRVLSSVRRRQ